MEKYDWNRRDFSATLQCEGCQHVQEHTSCYDDAFFHNNVVPEIPCEACGETTNSIGAIIHAPTLKYDPNVTL